MSAPLRKKSTEKEKIIYQYKLLKRIRFHPTVSVIYMGFLALWLLFFAWAEGYPMVLWGIAALLGLQVVYYSITIAVLSREPGGRESSSGTYPYHKRYRWLFRLPWCGYLPSASVPFRQFRNLQGHLLLVGTMIVSPLSIWLSFEAAITIGFIHLWWMAPRLFVVHLMQRAARSDSIISFTAHDAGLYSA